MELIRINDNKLKIMLTSLDMKNYALDARTLSCGTEETRRAFRSILHDAGVGGGFEEGKDKIYVQYYPSREGGCEMFVTKLALPKSSTEATDTDTAKALSLAECKDNHTAALAYRYDTLSLLLLACHHAHKALPPAHRKAISAAYRDDCGRFYLTVTLTTEEGNAPHRLSLLLGEFGTVCAADTLPAYIAEHATPLCRTHALETLGDL